MSNEGIICLGGFFLIIAIFFAIAILAALFWARVFGRIGKIIKKNSR